MTKHLPHYVKADYNQWEGDWELINGIAYAMAPSPSPFHQSISRNILLQLSESLQKSHCDCEVFYELDLHLSEDTILRPDLMICCEFDKSDYPNKASLVAEILSPNTKEKDLNLKFEIYQSFGIPCYLIFDPQARSIQAYRLQGNKYVSFENVDSFQVGDCELSLALEDIW